MKNHSLKDCPPRGGLVFRLASLILAALAVFIIPSNALAQTETRIISVYTNLDFGKIEIHSTKQLTLVIANKGDSDLTISSIDFPDGFEGFGKVSASLSPFGGLGGYFLVGFTNAIIPAGGQTNIFVIFTPTNVMHYGGTVTVASDATRGQGKFTISGEGVYPTGRYVGLFSPDQPPAGVILYSPGTNGTFDNSGYFSANVTVNGGFSGALLLAGVRHPFSGRLSSSGAFSGILLQAGGNDLGASFQISPGAWEGTISNQTWAANLVAWRATPDPTLFLPNDGMPPNKYHFRIAGSTNSLLAPTNDGVGTIQITASRAAHLRGILGDGTVFSQETVLSQRNEVPLYALLYQHRSAVMGWVSCVIEPTNLANGIAPTNFPQIPPILITNISRTNLPPFTNYPPATNIVVITPQSAPTLPASTIDTPLRDDLRNHPNPIEKFTVKGTNWIYGSVRWIKPAQIDSNYPDGFSLNTTVNGPID